jgi:quinol monooxygenase YgiN
VIPAEVASGVLPAVGTWWTDDGNRGDTIMTKVGVIAKITAAEGRRDEVAEGLKKMIPTVEGEEGTELYILHEDTGSEDVLWMYELYRDAEALGTHSSSPAMAELMGALGGDLMGAPPELIVLHPVTAKGVDL